METDPYQRLWEVVKGKGTLLHEGDIFKLGKEQVCVRAVGVTGKEEHTWYPAPVAVSTYASSSRREPGKCHICLGDEDGEDDPLISPCNCLGSVQYIHLKCLQEWLKTRLSRVHPSEHTTAYELKSLFCELCKSVLPAAIAIDGKTHFLVEAWKSSDPFIVLEVVSRRHESSMHVLSLQPGSSVQLGRSPLCAAVLQDMSVSRFHAAIILLPTGFWLRDLGSTFGTVREVRDSAMVLKRGNQAMLQCGRTVVTLKVCQPAKWLYFCCSCCYPVERVRPDVTFMRHTTSSVFQTTVQQVEEYAGQERELQGEDRTRLVLF